MERYVCERRGRLARIRWYPAVVVDLETGARMLVRSPQLGEDLAGLLIAADAYGLPTRPPPETPFERYLCVEQTPGSYRLFRAEGALIGDPIAKSSDGDLCSRAAGVLNRVDPAQKIRVRTGIGWW